MLELQLIRAELLAEMHPLILPQGIEVALQRLNK